jgi:acetylornithine aminotransferase
MKPLDIYFQYPIELTWAKGIKLKDNKGKEYTDFYGGHGVISIGHSHPQFTKAITEQLDKIAFYSNAFKNDLQYKLSNLLGEISGYTTHNLFLSNSGAEANENAIKVASFSTGRKKILALKKAFHGRSAGAVAITDNKNIQPAFGSQIEVDFIEINNLSELKSSLNTKEYAALFIEGIQGVSGIWEANTEFWQTARKLCTETGTLLVADEVQSGYGRSGKFFAHQYHNIVADVVTTGKGMGNGFPVAGTIIDSNINLEKGLLGTTFGGGHLACSASISVLEVMQNDNLIKNTKNIGDYLIKELSKIDGVETIRGRGLMIGIEFNKISGKEVRQSLINDFGIITGFSGPDTLRILPPLNITKEDANIFLDAIISILKK